MFRKFNFCNKSDQSDIRKDYAPLKNSTLNVKLESICKHESNTNDCNLIEQLKEKQKQRKIILAEIKKYDGIESSGSFCVRKFADFLKHMENYGFEMGKELTWYVGRYADANNTKKQFNWFKGIIAIEKALKQITDEDIDTIAKELKVLKRRSVMLEEKRKQLESIDSEILSIKLTLGIE